VGAEIRAVENYRAHFGETSGIDAVPARYALERGAFAEAARLPVRMQATFPWDQYPQYEAITYFARGLGAARIGDVDAAREASRILDTLHKRTVEAGETYWAVQVDVKRTTVRAWTAHAEGRHEKALDHMQDAADLEDSVDKHPVTPSAVRPARELLGDMLTQLERPEDAIKAYQTALEISPNRFHSLYGIGRAAEMAGNRKMAQDAYGKLTELTDGASTEREEITRAKAFLAEN
jgi:tetratricopeptide (TPR) repeat protein